MLGIVVLSIFTIIPAQPAVAQERVILTAPAVGCVWEMQEKVRDYALAKDAEAVQNLWIAGILAGTCEAFNKGEQIIVLERSAWHNMARIKRVGAVRDYWVAGQPGR